MRMTGVKTAQGRFVGRFHFESVIKITKVIWKIQSKLKPISHN